MSSLLNELSQKARTLTADERTRLAHELLESVEREVAPDVQGAWDAEISRRVACYERGDAKLIAAADVFAVGRYLTR